MEALLDVLKYTLPGLIVAGTAYYLLKTLLESQNRGTQLAQRNEALKITLPIRLQAYERLTLLCDRAAITNVLLRVRMTGMSAAELRGALLLAISQEFSHNTSQQLYVSDTLWQIITLAKDETLAAVSRAAEELDVQDNDEEFIARLLHSADQQGYATPLQRAIIAIRTEAAQLF